MVQWLWAKNARWLLASRQEFFLHYSPENTGVCATQTLPNEENKKGLNFQFQFNYSICSAQGEGFRGKMNTQ